MAGTNFDIHAGETFSASFACLDVAGSPVDLTGYTARAQVRWTPTATAEILDLAPAIPTPANGIISVSVDTTGIDPGIYYWDIVLDTPDTEVIFLSGGTFKFRALVTRP
tara:strand:- start:769 stop:1095 length:327 start_codon:yes stop_codon:yes gene_type:complete